MQDYKVFLYDNMIKSFEYFNNTYLSRYDYYTIDKYQTAIKTLHPITYILCKNTFNFDLSKETVVKYTIIALCSVFNERKEVLDELIKDIKGEINENIIETIRLSMIKIFDINKKIYGKDELFENIISNTNQFIPTTITIYEFIRQNNLTYQKFNNINEKNSPEIINMIIKGINKLNSNK